VIKKLGVVTVGVAAGLMVAAPFASATEGGHHENNSGDSCHFKAGDSEANGGIGGDALVAEALTQAPVGGNNAANIACNDILNGNLNGNTVEANIGSGLDLPIELPGLPTAPAPEPEPS
jgi:hypothetical protein